MPRISVRTRCRIFATVMFTVASLLLVASHARAQGVAVLVSGEPITELDIAHRQKFREMSSHKAASRQEAINDLIDEMLELREAKRFGIEPGDSDVEEAFANIGTRMGVDSTKLTQILANSGASADTVKHRLKAQMAWTSLVRGRYKVSLEVPDTDVEAQLQLHKSEDKEQVVGYEYVVRPILLVVPHGAADAAFEARKRDAEALRVRFATCADGIPFARGLPEVAVRDSVNKSSADLAPELSDILNKTEIGHLTPPEQTSEGIQMFAVCSKKESKTDSPELKQIRDQMFEQKFGARAKRYLADLRRQAMIEYKSSETEQSKSASKSKAGASQ